jgi:uncharacterized protein YdhG (YjbR/CyaY superfamily)
MEKERTETVDDYLAALPDDDRDVLSAIREAIRQTVPDAEETLSYRIPLYKLDGKHLIGFGASTRHLSLFIIDSALLEQYERELRPFDHTGTKTTIRFTADRPVPKAVLKKLVRARRRDIRGS